MVGKHNKTVDEIFTYTKSSDIYEAKMCQALLNEPSHLHELKRYSVFHEKLHMLFGEQLNEENFLEWIADTLGIRKSRFLDTVRHWEAIQYKEGRGREGFSFESKQTIYNTWIENCITSTDGWNGRNVVQISKRKYLENYGELSYESIRLEEHRNKCGKLYCSSNCLVLTCTMRTIQKKLLEKGLAISLGKVLSLRPFFITYPTEKEISLCLCKMCLNVRLLFEPIKAQAKKDGDVCPASITEYFMSCCECPKSENGYYQLKCVAGKCKECKGHQPLSLKCQNNYSLTKVSQFELVTREYINKKKEKKKSEKTERVEYQLSYTAILQKLNESKWAYVLHKYQIYNDKLH